MKQEREFLNIPGSQEYPYHFTNMDIDELSGSNHAGVYLFAKRSLIEPDYFQYHFTSFGETENFYQTLKDLREDQKAKGSTNFCYMECSQEKRKTVLSDLAKVEAQFPNGF